MVANLWLPSDARAHRKRKSIEPQDDSGENLPRPRTREEAEALPSGTKFTEPAGNVQVRP